MKKIILSIILSLTAHSALFAEDALDKAIADGSAVWIGLAIAAVTIPLGLRIKSKDKSEKETVSSGCIAPLLILAGVVSLIPLLMWLFAVASIIMMVVIAGIAILYVVSVIISMFYDRKD